MSTAEDSKKGEQGWVPTAEEIIKQRSLFRRWVRADLSSDFPAENNRYHLYVSYACPWAHRALIVRKLKGLDRAITYDVVDWELTEGGWRFTGQPDRGTRDTVNKTKYLREVYELADNYYNGRITVPVLWDKKRGTIVNNDSSDIMRMMNLEFNALSISEEQARFDLCPSHLKSKIDEFNSWIYESINNGVYKAGFARSQHSYDKAVRVLFEGLDRLEGVLSKSRYLCGDELTEADIKLFTTLIRFDKVYVGHFKCNKRRLIDYPNLWAYTRDIFQMPAVRDTVRFDHIEKHYQVSHKNLNPQGIVSIGPDINYDEPHGRHLKFGGKY